MRTVCHYCGKEIEKATGHYNRSKKLGLNVYCGKVCAWKGHRTNETEQEKKQIKYWYDAFIRLCDEEKFKKQRQEYFKKDYAANPEKYREQRRRRYPEHLKYLQKPEYKKYKQAYDQQYRAKKLYGDFGEAAIVLHQLRTVVDNRRAKQDQGLFNKSQKRKRNAKKSTFKCQELEGGSLGFYQPGKNR